MNYTVDSEAGAGIHKFVTSGDLKDYLKKNLYLMNVE